jgi:hypothetical protein
MDNNTYKLIKTILIIAIFITVIYLLRDGIAKMYNDVTRPGGLIGDNIKGLKFW